jgi:hypothetical protein
MSLQRCTFRCSKGKGRYDQNFDHERGRPPLQFGRKVRMVGINEDAAKMTARQVRAARGVTGLVSGTIGEKGNRFTQCLVEV